MKVALTVLAIGLAGAGASAQTGGGASGGAYYEFLLGRYLDSTGDLDGALEAMQRAAKLDARSAEIQADLAGLFVRSNRPSEAIAAGQQAVENDPDNVTANRVLGSIYASLAQNGRTNPAAARANTERAIRHLEKSDPDNSASVQLLLGRMYVEAEMWDSAIGMLSRLVREQPGITEALILLAEAYDAAGRRAEAIGALENGAGSSSRLSAMLGELYEREGRWADAADAYDRASRRRPRDVDLKVRMASSLLNVGTTPAFERARVALREVADGNPSHVRGTYLLVQVERALLDPKGAERAARDMIAAAADGAWGRYALAQALADQHDYRGVVETLEPVLAAWASRRDGGQGLNPVRLHEQLAQAYQGLGQYDRAIDQYDRARQIAPDDLRLTRSAAQAHRQNGQLDRGVNLLEQFVRDNGESAPAYVSLAELYVEGGRIPQALEVIERAASRLPGDTSVPFGVGNALERLQHYAEAERVFQGVLEADPNHVETLNSFGYMLAVRGVRLEESIEYIKRALEFEPDNPAIIDSLGWAYFKLNQLDLAERYLRQAATDLAGNSVVQDHLGDALFQQGNVEGALEAWSRALEGDGEAVDRAAIERKIESAREKTKSR